MMLSMSKILPIRSLADIGKTHSSAKSKVDEMDLIVIWGKLWKVVYFDNFGVLQKNFMMHNCTCWYDTRRSRQLFGFVMC